MKAVSINVVELNGWFAFLVTFAFIRLVKIENGPVGVYALVGIPFWRTLKADDLFGRSYKVG